jgi:hypothetical protein
VTAEHDRAFFEEMAACRVPYRRLGDAIHHVLGPRLAIDVGAGLGFVAGRLAELGWDATASDLYAPEELRDRACNWLDLPPLNVPWFDTRPVDVTICTETAEHIDGMWAGTIVANVARLATEAIVWSAAPPGQEAPQHINLQAPTYWLDRFALFGWEPTPETDKLRREMLERHAQHEYAASNFYILRRSS